MNWMDKGIQIDVLGNDGPVRTTQANAQFSSHKLLFIQRDGQCAVNRISLNVYGYAFLGHYFVICACRAKTQRAIPVSLRRIVHDPKAFVLTEGTIE